MGTQNGNHKAPWEGSNDGQLAGSPGGPVAGAENGAGKIAERGGGDAPPVAKRKRADVVRAEADRSGADFLKTLVAKIQADEFDECPSDISAAKKWPALWQLLTHFRDLDDKRVDGGAFSVFPRGGVWAWSLRSPSMNLKLSGECPSLEALLDTLEAAVRSPDANWVPLDKQKADKRREKNKKS